MEPGVGLELPCTIPAPLVVLSHTEKRTLHKKVVLTCQHRNLLCVSTPQP